MKVNWVQQWLDHEECKKYYYNEYKSWGDKFYNHKVVSNRCPHYSGDEKLKLVEIGGIVHYYHEDWWYHAKVTNTGSPTNGQWKLQLMDLNPTIHKCAHVDNSLLLQHCPQQINKKSKCSLSKSNNKKIKNKK